MVYRMRASPGMTTISLTKDSMKALRSLWSVSTRGIGQGTVERVFSDELRWRARAMTGKTQPLYFDEAGFTGNNLLDPEQPAFVYAGVAMDKEHAARLHRDVLSLFRINAQELKGSSLLKSSKGRRAISWLLAKSSRCSYVMVANKEYALAGKFFEHIFEPALSERNSLFYAIGFHRFIATLLYMCNRAADPNVGSALRNFAEMMRSMNPDQLVSVLASLDHFDQSNPIGMVLAFALCHQSRIKREIEVIRESPAVSPISR